MAKTSNRAAAMNTPAMPVAGHSAGQMRSHARMPRAAETNAFVRLASEPRRNSVGSDKRVIGDPWPDHTPLAAPDQDLWGGRPCIVGRGHHRAIGPCRQERDKIARLEFRKVAVAGKEIGGFADGTDDIIMLTRMSRPRFRHRHDLV